MKHSFTEKIVEILTNHFGDEAESIFNNSELLKYINQKTISAHKYTLKYAEKNSQMTKAIAYFKANWDKKR